MSTRPLAGSRRGRIRHRSPYDARNARPASSPHAPQAHSLTSGAGTFGWKTCPERTVSRRKTAPGGSATRTHSPVASQRKSSAITSHERFTSARISCDRCRVGLQQILHPRLGKEHGAHVPKPPHVRGARGRGGRHDARRVVEQGGQRAAAVGQARERGRARAPCHVDVQRLARRVGDLGRPPPEGRAEEAQLHRGGDGGASSRLEGKRSGPVLEPLSPSTSWRLGSRTRTCWLASSSAPPSPHATSARTEGQSSFEGRFADDRRRAETRTPARLGSAAWRAEALSTAASDTKQESAGSTPAFCDPNSHNHVS